jgi:parvulin-like peptidyl-prolyl isomerase
MTGQTWKIRILGGALVVGALIGGGNLVSIATAAPKAAAVVNGVVIPMADFDAMMRLAGLSDPMPVEMPNDRKKMMQMQVLGSMIDEVIIQQFLNKNTAPVPAAEVEKKFVELKTSLDQQKKTIADFCRESGTTEDSIRKDIAARLQWANYASTRITEADLQKYYKEFKDYFDGVTVRCSHIVIRLPFNAPDAEKASVTAKLMQLRQQLLDKKISFPEAAKMYSHCPSAKQGGDLNFIPRKGLVDDEFARVAFSLPVGQISTVVQTDFGLHLIMVTERKDGKPSEYQKVINDVREMVTAELWNTILMQQRKAAKIEINLP